MESPRRPLLALLANLVLLAGFVQQDVQQCQSVEALMPARPRARRKVRR